MHCNDSAGSWDSVLGAQHLLSAHKGVSEVGSNPPGEVIQLVCAVMHHAYDWLLVNGWKLQHVSHNGYMLVSSPGAVINLDLLPAEKFCFQLLS